MPVKAFIPIHPRKYEKLVDELYDEWQNPNPLAQEPLILEERDRNGHLVHVYVVWSKWAQLDGIDRSEIIMDAAEKKLSPPDLLEITIAMGLTQDEGKRMGIIS